MGLVEESKFHVLAVDDSLIDRKLIERLLKTSSFQVTTVDSGSKALEFLGFSEEEQIKPNDQSNYSKCQQVVEVNLIITDYCMPGMTGYDLLKKVKESSSLRNIPVVIMSSENVPSRITRCLEEGAEEFFLKPVRKSDMNKLRHHMMKTIQVKKNEIPETQGYLEKTQLQLDQKHQKEEENHQQQEEPNSNKRKSIEEGLSPDRTRPRYSDLTVTVVSN